MAYYQVGVPSIVWGGYIDAAWLNADEAYTASCSASADVTLSSTSPINQGTDWSNAPGVASDIDTVDVGPGPSNSCNTVVDESPGDWSGVGFDVTSLIDKASSLDWKAITFRLWEQGSSS